MKSHHVDLLNEAIAPALTRLALPIMATSLVQMLYNLTDMAWIGTPRGQAPSRRWDRQVCIPGFHRGLRFWRGRAVR